MLKVNHNLPFTDTNNQLSFTGTNDDNVAPDLEEITIPEPILTEADYNNVELNVIQLPVSVEDLYLTEADYNNVELNVIQLPVSVEDLYVDIEQEKERIESYSEYAVASINGVYLNDVTCDSDEKLNAKVYDNIIINQKIDDILVAYALFKSNDTNVMTLSKYTSLDFGNGIKALLSFTFANTNANQYYIVLNYGWKVDDSTCIDQGSLNNCYSYITQRFKTTLEDVEQMAQLHNFNVEVKPYSNEGKIFSHAIFDEGLKIGNDTLHKIIITKTN